MYKSRIKNSKNRNNRYNKKREMVYPDEEYQEYGFIKNMLGNGRVSVLCEDKSIKTGRICGSMRNHRRKTLIEQGDLVIIASRDYDDGKVDVIHKYTDDETSFLVSNDYLTEYLLKVYNNRMEINYDNNNEVQENGMDEYIMFTNHINTENTFDIDEEKQDINDEDIDNI